MELRVKEVTGVAKKDKMIEDGWKLATEKPENGRIIYFMTKEVNKQNGANCITDN